MFSRTFALGVIVASVIVGCAPQEQAEFKPVNMKEWLELSWRFTLESTGEFGEPHTNVSVILRTETDTKEISLGSYTITPFDASPIANPDQWKEWEEDIAKGELLLAATGWWAGGGDEFLVVREMPHTLVIKHRFVDEESGFGKWEDLRTIAIQPTVSIRAAAPASSSGSGMGE